MLSLAVQPKLVIACAVYVVFNFGCATGSAQLLQLKPDGGNHAHPITSGEFVVFIGNVEPAFIVTILSTILNEGRGATRIEICTVSAKHFLLSDPITV